MNRTTAREQAVGRGRLTLLVVLVLGVAGMHTLGHVGDTGHHAAPAALGHADNDVTLVHAPTDQPPAASGTGETPGDGPSLDLFAVCLAVLGAASILLGMARTGRLCRGHARLQRAVRAPRRAGRGPPSRPLGLRLAVVSVSRT
jgi:hypothetical protein